MQLVVELPSDPSGKKDLAILEMQGDLESRSGEVEMRGKLIGDLHYTKDASHTPVLIIGHHILYGKVINLDNPMVVMQKRAAADIEEEGNGNPKDTHYSVQCIVRKKLLFKTRPKPIIANVPKKI